MLAQIERYYGWLLGMVLVCYGGALFHAYVGEEANYTIMSMEMWQRQIFRSVVSFGGVGGRPPLYNWLMIPVACGVGWGQVLLAARLVTLLATLGTAGVLALWARRLWGRPMAGRLTFLLYLSSADVLLYRGWLAYADPLFSFWMVLSGYALWRAVDGRHLGWLLGSLLAIFASYLTKVITAYVFYGGMVLVWLTQPNYRAFLCSRRTWGVMLLGLLPMGVWLAVVGRQDSIQVHWQMSDIVTKLLTVDSLSSYLGKLVTFPVTILLGLLPASLWVVAGMIGQWHRGEVLDLRMRGLLAMAGVNFFPYWIAPQSAPRYVLPEYGLVVLMAVGYLMEPAWLTVPRGLRPFPWLVGMGVIGGMVALLGFPYYQHHVRGDNYARMADRVESAAGAFPLYNDNFTSVGLSVVALIDARHMARPALVVPPRDFADGVVMAAGPQDIQGEHWARIEEESESLYVICRGAACAAPIFQGGRRAWP
ncbi:MAG: hypothetical protein M0Z78_02815 [Betaproteobacteria bacterium]|nr:hypothetical protein [Betaproteobacteria bacterium]